MSYSNHSQVIVALSYETAPQKVDGHLVSYLVQNTKQTENDWPVVEQLWDAFSTDQKQELLNNLLDHTARAEAVAKRLMKR